MQRRINYQRKDRYHQSDQVNQNHWFKVTSQIPFHEIKKMSCNNQEMKDESQQHKRRLNQVIYLSK
ncbi:hypothetical protein H7F33_04770 [Pedobacter sp. PAMC26386]|nr:hypothetical protein H7F33_04770 [Pedobacter sp. PAMC26386]